jgi:hypothetical protein
MTGEPAKRITRLLARLDVVAVLGLIAAIVVGSNQVRLNTRAVRQSREAAQLQLFTTLDSTLHASQATLARDSTLGTHLSAQQRGDLDQSLSDVDELAFLLNHGHISLAEARTYWFDSARCIYLAAVGLEGDESAIRNAYPDLARFAGRGPPCKGTPF